MGSHTGHRCMGMGSHTGHRGMGMGSHTGHTGRGMGLHTGHRGTCHTDYSIAVSNNSVLIIGASMSEPLSTAVLSTTDHGARLRSGLASSPGSQKKWEDRGREK